MLFLSYLLDFIGRGIRESPSYFEDELRYQSPIQGWHGSTMGQLAISSHSAYVVFKHLPLWGCFRELKQVSVQ